MHGCAHLAALLPVWVHVAERDLEPPHQEPRGYGRRKNLQAGAGPRVEVVAC
jgi:hypothetical protein